MRHSALDRQTARRWFRGPGGIGLAPVLCSAILAACAPAQLSLVTVPAAPARTAGAVAILALEPFALGAEPCDPERVAECLRRALVRQRPGLHVVPPEEFAQVAYPGLEISEAPRQPEYVALLLDDPEFRARIEPLHLRYVVVVGGLTTTRHLWGDIACYYGCVGLTAAEQETRLAATLIDVERSERMREVTASRERREYFAVFVVFPFFKPAGTVSPACRTVAGEILRAVDELESGAENGVGQAGSGERP